MLDDEQALPDDDPVAPDDERRRARTTPGRPRSRRRAMTTPWCATTNRWRSRTDRDRAAPPQTRKPRQVPTMSRPPLGSNDRSIWPAADVDVYTGRARPPTVRAGPDHPPRSAHLRRLRTLRRLRRRLLVPLGPRARRVPRVLRRARPAHRRGWRCGPSTRGSRGSTCVAAPSRWRGPSWRRWPVSARWIERPWRTWPRHAGAVATSSAAGKRLVRTSMPEGMSRWQWSSPRKHSPPRAASSSRGSSPRRSRIAPGPAGAPVRGPVPQPLMGQPRRRSGRPRGGPDLGPAERRPGGHLTRAQDAPPAPRRPGARHPGPPHRRIAHRAAGIRHGRLRANSEQRARAERTAAGAAAPRGSGSAAATCARRDCPRRRRTLHRRARRSTA